MLHRHLNHGYGLQITVPTISEMLRIKGVLILKRNATRDYLDFAALADQSGDEQIADSLRYFDPTLSRTENRPYSSFRFNWRPRCLMIWMR